MTNKAKNISTIYGTYVHKTSNDHVTGDISCLKLQLNQKRQGWCQWAEHCDLIHISSVASSNTANPCLHVYRGPAAESEKETKAVTNFIRRHKNSIKAYITFHAYSQVLLFPYGYTSKLPPNYDNLVCNTYIYKCIHICVCAFTLSLILNLFFNSFEVC